MKKITFGFAVLALVFSFVSFVPQAHASCGDIDPITNQVIACGNGPIVPQIPGGRFLKAGEEDCPWWFPMMFGHACYTFRPLGASYIK